MIVIIGLIVLFGAAIVGTIGVLANAGSTHPLSEQFSVLGYHVTGSTGALFLSGIVVGAVGCLGLSVLLAGARRSAGRRRDARLGIARSKRESDFVNRGPAPLQERRQHGADASSATNATAANPTGTRVSRFGRWTRRRQTVDDERIDARG
jgi:hypothetical protein